MKKLTMWFAAIGFAAMMMSGGVVRADHSRLNPLLALSEDLRCQADELRGAFREQFRHSASYHELMRKSQDVKNTAARVRSLSRSDGNGVRLVREIEALERFVYEMASLVEVARLRSARGLDRPLYGCTLHVDAKLGRMRQTVWAMTRALHGGRGGFRHDDRYGYSGWQAAHGYRGAEYSAAPGFAIQGPRDRAGVHFGGDGGLVLNIGGATFRVR